MRFAICPLHLLHLGLIKRYVDQIGIAMGKPYRDSTFKFLIVMAILIDCNSDQRTNIGTPSVKRNDTYYNACVQEEELSTSLTRILYLRIVCRGYYEPTDG